MTYKHTGAGTAHGRLCANEALFACKFRFERLRTGTKGESERSGSVRFVQLIDDKRGKPFGIAVKRDFYVLADK